jgi:hypothetical protein
VPTLTCPNGHRFRIPPIKWGMPTPAAMAKIEAGRLLAAGCDPSQPFTVTCPRDGQVVVVRSGVRLPSGRGSEASGEPI